MEGNNGDDAAASFGALMELVANLKTQVSALTKRVNKKVVAVEDPNVVINKLSEVISSTKEKPSLKVFTKEAWEKFLSEYDKYQEDKYHQTMASCFSVNARAGFYGRTVVKFDPTISNEALIVLMGKTFTSSKADSNRECLNTFRKVKCKDGVTSTEANLRTYLGDLALAVGAMELQLIDIGELNIKELKNIFLEGLPNADHPCFKGWSTRQIITTEATVNGIKTMEEAWRLALQHADLLHANEAAIKYKHVAVTNVTGQAALSDSVIKKPDKNVPKTDTNLPSNSVVNPTNGKRMYCSVCGENSHYISDCPCLNAEQRAKVKKSREAHLAHLANKRAVIAKSVEIENVSANVIAVITVRCFSDETSERKPDEIGLDTMCDHSITNTREMLGQLYNDMHFLITGVHGESILVKQYGFHKWYGKMIYYPAAHTTLLSYFQLFDTCDVYWTHRSTVCRIVPKCDANVVLNFSRQQGHRLLILSNDSAMVGANSSNTSVLACIAKVPEGIRTSDYQRALACIQFHDAMGHPGKESMKRIVRAASIVGLPFSEKDVDVAEKIRGICPVCAVAKATQSNGIRRGPAALPAIHPDSADGTEVIGFDLFFIKTQCFLMARSKHMGMMHTVPISSKATNVVTAAIQWVLNEYQKAGHSPTIQLAADGEGAITAAFSGALGVGHKVQTYASGEHVTWVERGTRTGKERERAVESSLPYLLNTPMLNKLVEHVCYLINAIPQVGYMLSPMMMFDGTRPTYEQISRAPFGRAIVAKQSSALGKAYGEPGVSLGLGGCGRTDALWMYSLHTNQCKRRVWFATVATYDLVAHFGANPEYIPPPMVYASVEAYTRNLPRVHLPGYNLRSGADIPEGSFSGAPIDASDAPFSGATLETPLSGASTDVSAPSDNLVSGDTLSDWVSNGERTVHFADSPTTEEDGIRRNDEAAAYDNQVTLSEQSGDTPDLYAQLVSKEQLADPPTGVSGIPEEQSEMIADENDSMEQIAAMLPKIKPLSEMQLRERLPREAKDKPYNRFIGAVYAITLVNAFTLVSACAVSGRWKQAADIVGEEAAAAAIDKEVEQLFAFDVLHPQAKDVDLRSIPNLLRSLDIITKKLDGSAKARIAGAHPYWNNPIDYGRSTFSPTLDFKLILMLLSMFLMFGLQLEVWDVKGAFLQTKMVKRDVYVLITKPIADRMIALRSEWNKYVRSNGTILCLCNKALYGSEIASALWYDDIKDSIVNACGYTQHETVPCIFYRKIDKTWKSSIIMLHVDDMGCGFLPDGIERNRVKDILESKYGQLKTQTGNNVTYIGVECSYDKKSNTIKATMEQRIKDLAALHNVTVGMKSACYASTFTDHIDCPKVDITMYRSLVMSLRYIASVVRPEILFHTTYLATCQSNPNEKHWKDALHVLAYLLHTCNEGMLIGAMERDSWLAALTDASHILYSDGKSQSAAALFLKGMLCCMYMSSNKQTIFANSSTDAETCALHKKIYMVEYIVNVLRPFGINCKVKYFQDNKACIDLVKTGTNKHATKSRNMVTKINELNEYFTQSDGPSIEHIATVDNTSDIGTKPLFEELFNKHTATLQGRGNSSEFFV